jgi:phosphoenolpyruvate carboxykinase (ATP)
MPLHPKAYAELLGEKVRKHQVNCWLINTGWSGGPYGVGARMDIIHTRALLNAALDGDLRDVDYVEHPIFRVEVPQSCPGVPSKILNPEETWPDRSAYEEKARELAASFHKNFAKFKDSVDPAVWNAGPVHD